MVPTWTGKMGKNFPVREKLENFEQTGKVREFNPEDWKSEGILTSFIFSRIFLIEVYLKYIFVICYLLNS